MMKKYTILETDFYFDLINIFDELSVIDFTQGIESQIMVLDEDFYNYHLSLGLLLMLVGIQLFKRMANLLLIE